MGDHDKGDLLLLGEFQHPVQHLLGGGGVQVAGGDVYKRQGYDSATNESTISESLMITSDLNFVNVDFFLEYRVVDPVAYLYASQEPTLILRTLAQSYIRDTIGLYPVDEVITTGKNQIQSEIKDKLAARIEAEAIGLQVVNLTIQDAEPPTAEVLAAFKEVENAKQGADTAVNNANKYRSEQLPAAEALSRIHI